MFVSAFGLMSFATDFTHVASFDVGGEGAAEIVAYQKSNHELWVLNGADGRVDIFDFSDVSNPSLKESFDYSSYGAGAQSIAINDTVVAVALEALTSKQDDGVVIFIGANSKKLLSQATAGALPDMVKFTHDGSKVLVANEGEPNDDYSIDPEGSITIINVSDVTSPVATQVGFTDFNADSLILVNKGVNIYGPGASVAMDIEPEYIAVADDDVYAYVTCQENNAVAVVDIASAKVIDIMPLGYKDHSKGTPEIAQVLINEEVTLPELGTPIYAAEATGGATNAETVLLGGFSGLCYDATQSSGTQAVFYAIPDRGPNGATVAKADVGTSQNLRPFYLPDYQSRIVKFTVDMTNGMPTLNEEDQIFLTDADGYAISGKGNVPGVDEVPVTYIDDEVYTDTAYIDSEGTAYAALSYDPYGGDFEGIIRDNDGNFWMCDEYRPAIYKFSETGVMLNRFVPAGISDEVSADELFFSEYAEGSSNNKYLEIYNPTDAAIELDNYAILTNYNGNAWSGFYTFGTEVEIAAGDVYVIANSSATSAIKAEADTTFAYNKGEYIVGYNGDDVRALVKFDDTDTTILDIIGRYDMVDPGSGWNVAGVTNGTADYTLVRKSSVFQGTPYWSQAAGSNESNSQWIVADKATADYTPATLGNHSMTIDFGTESLPAVYNQRRANRGFEAIAYDSTSELIYAFIQSPMYNPGSSIKNASNNIRILAIDLDGNPVHEYLYLLENGMKGTSFSSDYVDKIGDAVCVDSGQFYVVERGSAHPTTEGYEYTKKYIFHIDLSGATDILGTEISNATESTTLEEMTPAELAEAGIQPVFKVKMVNLPTVGYEGSDKTEGIALLPGGGIALINDNDFGLAGAGDTDDISLGYLWFDENYGFDASNKADDVMIVNHPVLGRYQPDAIDVMTYNGMDYFITANEGDAREYIYETDEATCLANGHTWDDGDCISFIDEARIKDIVLDPTYFPNYEDLQEKDSLGRLKINTTMGDIDGDGEYEYLFSYGARSFSIFDQYGNLVWDSGDDFEQITNDSIPLYFNGDDFEWKGRSDDKGPEPEGVVLGNVNSKTYAFIGLERVNGIMVYDVTNPNEPAYIDYLENIDYSDSTGDISPEGIIYIPGEDSPNGKNLLIASYEVSGTVAIFGSKYIPYKDIYDIQYTESGDSPYKNDTVQTSGIVTDTLAYGYFIQSGEGEWDGVYVYDTNNTTMPGDSILITAKVTEYHGLTELFLPYEFSIISSDNELPEPIMVTDSLDEALEGVLITIEGAVCINDDAGYGEWVVELENGDQIKVDEQLFEYTPTLDVVYNITGIVNYSYSEYKIAPRSEDDIDELSAPITLQLLHASDLEGGLEAIENAPNFAALVEEFEGQYPDQTIKVSSGDNFIPSPFFNAAADDVVEDSLQSVYTDFYGVDMSTIESGRGIVDQAIMNIIGLDASAVGNHEFDAGTDVLADIINIDGIYGDLANIGIQFPYLSANLDFTGDDNLSWLYADTIAENTAYQHAPADIDDDTWASKIAPATIITRQGEKIGVVGATTQLLESISSVGGVEVEGSNENNMEELASILQPTIDKILEQGINKIIVVSHLQQIALEKSLIGYLKGVDVICAGGSDVVMVNDDNTLYPGTEKAESYPIKTSNADNEPALIVSTDGEYRYVGRLVVDFDGYGIVDTSAAGIDAVSGGYASVIDVVKTECEADSATIFATNTKGELVHRLTAAVQAVVTVKDGVTVGFTAEYLNGARESVRTEETNLGNLSADANLALARSYDSEVKVSLKNGGGIRAAIGEVVEVEEDVYDYLPPQANALSGKDSLEISQLDIENSLRFNNGLSVITITNEGLVKLIEHGVSTWEEGSTPGGMCQVGGLRFSFHPDSSAYNRIQTMVIIDSAGNSLETIVKDGEIVADPAAEIKMVTLDYLYKNDGDSYPFTEVVKDAYDLADVLTDAGLSAFADPGSEQDAFAEYMLANYSTDTFDLADTEIEEDLRIQNLKYRDEEMDLGYTPIYDIQFTDADTSDYYGYTLTTSGIVTGIGSSGYFIQSETGEWNGIYVYDYNTNPSVGDSLVMTATVAEYYALTELKYTETEIISSDNDLPAAMQITDSLEESSEGVLVYIENAECTNTNTGYGEWRVKLENGDQVTIDERFYSYTPVLGLTYDITGPVYFDYYEYKIAPCSISDIVEHNVDPTLATEIADVTVSEGFSTSTVDLSAAFSDLNAADSLMYTFSLSTEDYISAAISADGKSLEVTEKAIGATTITITATDGNGGATASDEFTFTIEEHVNTAPTVANEIADMNDEIGFGSVKVNLTSVFTDADGDDLTYSVSVSGTSVTAEISASGDSVVISDEADGTSTITVEANDGNGGTVTDEFTFTVDATSVEDITADNYNIYPNPTSGLLVIELVDIDAAEISIYDMTGKVVKDQEVFGAETVVDMTGLSSGMYFVKIIAGESVAIEQIIRE